MSISATFVQGNSTFAFNSTVTKSATFSAPNGVSNLLFCVAKSGNAGTTFTISDTSNNTWIPLSAGLLNATVGAVQAFYCLNSNGGANTVTITDATSGTTSRYITIGEWTGGTFVALDQQNANDSGFGITSAGSGSITTQDANDILIGYFYLANSRTVSASGGNTIEFTDASGQIFLADQNVSSTGTYSSAISWTGGTSGCGAGIAAFQIIAYAPFNARVGRFNDAGGLVGALFAPTWTNVNVIPVTVSANSTSDQNLMSAIVPANTLNKYGRALKIHLSGVYSTPAASTATLEFKVKLGTLTLIDITSTANAGSVTNNKWSLDADISTQTAGSSAAFESNGNLIIDLGAATTIAMSTFADANTSTVGTVDSTVQQTLQVTVAFSAGSASNSCTQRQLILNTVN